MDSSKVQTPMTETRPSTAGLIELHAYLVPEDLWNPKLNKVSIDVIWRFVSLGFIRVPPDMRLRTLRENLTEFLGEDAITDKFVFLKSIGSSLAVVKSRQEHELKVKSFAPPYAREPELYLLPGGSNEGSTYGSTITPDEHHYHADYSGSDRTDPAWDKPIIPPIHENKSPTPQPRQEDNGRRSFIWNRRQQQTVPIANQYHVHIEEESLLPLMNGKISNALNSSEKENSDNTKKLTGRNPTSDSGISDSLLGVENEHSQRQRKEKPLKANPVNSQTKSQHHQFGDTTFRRLVEPAHYQPPPSPPLLPELTTIESPKPQPSARSEPILEQLNRIKEERIQLEKSRDEMVKRIKSMLEQYKLRRQQARDSWKKKYFETKKVTSPLEETLNKLKNEQDTYYKKLLTQLAARDSRQRNKNPTLAANSKNSIIMKITSKQQELDQLKRKVENARTKLLVEIKMRKQASSDLNVLKAELAHKKATSGLPNPPLYAT